MKKLIIGAALLALFILGCGEEGTRIEGQEPVEPTSPAAVLTNVTVAFNQGNLDILEGVVGPSFVFYFDPDDVGQNPPGGNSYVIPEFWNRTEFLAAACNMLELAYSIDLAIPTGGISQPEPGAETYRAENVTMSLLVMVSELNGYIANQGYCDFELEKYTNQAGQARWRLTGWWDNTRTNFDAGADPASLGRVLAMYYKM
ncbi:MAG: hypothetical protein PVH29_02415 [Candidatus Zixiibacteriota bacterium]